MYHVIVKPTLQITNDISPPELIGSFLKKTKTRIKKFQAVLRVSENNRNMEEEL